MIDLNVLPVRCLPGVAMVQVYSLLSLFSLLHTSLAGSCCLTKVVQGNDELAGSYSLYNGAATFLPTCMLVSPSILQYFNFN